MLIPSSIDWTKLGRSVRDTRLRAKIGGSLSGYWRNTINSSIGRLPDSQRDTPNREWKLPALSPEIDVIPSSAERKIRWSASEIPQTVRALSAIINVIPSTLVPGDLWVASERQ
jgi:hypothetical protein